MKTVHILTLKEKRWSYPIWCCWLIIFMIFEFLGLSSKTPWRTLSETVWSIEAGKKGKILRVVLDGSLDALKHHISDPYWPGSPPPGYK